MQLPFYDYVIVEDDDDDDFSPDDDDTPPSGWSMLPAIVLEEVFSFLPQKDRYSAALVCRRWADAFDAPSVWRKMEVRAESFLCKKMRFRRTSHGNGRYQKTHVHQEKVDSPKLFTEALNFVGRYLNSLEILPIADYRKVVDLLRVLESPKTTTTNLAEVDINDGLELSRLREFVFRFAFTTMETCYEGTQILGTGGVILESLTTCLTRFASLKRVNLENLFLDEEEGAGVLNSLADCPGLRSIEAFNLTKEATTTIDLEKFSKLECLLISPLQLTEELVERLPSAAGLRRLHVVFDEFSCLLLPAFDRRQWNRVRERKPGLVLGLRGRGNFRGDFPIISHAPVTEVVHNFPYSEFTTESIRPILECYKTSLTCYAHLHLPCAHSNKSSADRAHQALEALIASCPRLETVAVRDLIYSSSILYLLQKYPKLKNFHVRQRGILFRNSFSPVHDRSLSSTEHRFFRENARSAASLRRGIETLLRSKWRPLSDAAFKRCIA